MENRWSDRKYLELGVDVYQDGNKILSCCSRDVCLGGAFLSIKPAPSLLKDSDVELVFHLVEDHQNKKHTLHAKVVRLCDDGVGLKFQEFNTSVFRSLQEIMSYKTKKQAAMH